MSLQWVDPHHTIPYGSVGVAEELWHRQGLLQGVGPQYFTVHPYSGTSLPDPLSSLFGAKDMLLWGRDPDPADFGGNPFCLRRGYPYPEDFTSGAYLDQGSADRVSGLHMRRWNQMPRSEFGNNFSRVYSPLFPPQVSGAVFWHAWVSPYGEVRNVPTNPDNPDTNFWEAHVMANWILRYATDSFGEGSVGWEFAHWESNSDMGEEIEPDIPGEDPTFVGWNPGKRVRYRPVVPNYNAANLVYNQFWSMDGEVWFDTSPPPEAVYITQWLDPGSIVQNTTSEFYDWKRPTLFLHQNWPFTPPPVGGSVNTYSLAMILMPYYP
jgi:hypothetical protein